MKNDSRRLVSYVLVGCGVFLAAKAVAQTVFHAACMALTMPAYYDEWGSGKRLHCRESFLGR